MILSQTMLSAGRQGSGSWPSRVNSGGINSERGLQVGVHAGGIGLVDRLCVGLEHLEVALGDAVEAERAQEPVGLDGRLAHHLREPRLADPALHLELPEPVLRMDVAHGEGAVLWAIAQRCGGSRGRRAPPPPAHSRPGTSSSPS